MSTLYRFTQEQEQAQLVYVYVTITDNVMWDLSSLYSIKHYLQNTKKLNYAFIIDFCQEIAILFIVIIKNQELGYLLPSCSVTSTLFLLLPDSKLVLLNA